ncbi:plasmid partitioning protein RepB [Primorskyibacter sp. 2E107]|uniref:plasmid partitioning protein RepB n=1 Tax=Primorskyibacter sp. 2E107 TaxID=3403458 RepID=UPI003AF8DB74
MARKGILNIGSNTPQDRKKPDAPAQPRGAVGALQSSLTRLQENAVQDLDPHLIDAAGMQDRLGVDETADKNLLDSLQTYGQQVPVLVRPHTSKPGRYEIVYGRRRVLAARDLGMTVKAMVRHLDDQALVLAQGQENTARQDLSFIEKASFAAQLDASGYDRATIAAALSIDMPMVSRMLKVGRAFDIAFLQKIGSAPGIGRDRWMMLADLMEQEAVRTYLDEMMVVLPYVDGSDARFEKVLAWAKGERPHVHQAKPDKPGPRLLRSADGAPLAEVRRVAKGLTLTIPAKTSDGFDSWLEDHAETLIQDLHDRWQTQRHEDN